MLRTLSCRVERWTLAKPFRISRGIKTEAEVVTVAVHAGDVSGAGEAVPYARYGETPQTVCDQINSIAADIANGATRETLLALLPAGAARNAVDCALWDLEARMAGALPRALTARRIAPIATAITLSLDRPEAMASAAAKAVAGGARLVKVKLDADGPADCLRAIRQAAPNVPLIVDANEAWTLSQLLALHPVLHELQVAFVEQPLPAAEDACLEGLKFLVPVCADESCHTSADLDRLAKRYTMVNVKLDKSGGLTEALRLVAGARARGLGVMVGCMVCTSLAIAPAFHIAVQADFVDLDGPLWLAEDRAGGAKMMQDGLLTPPEPALWGGA